MNAKVPIHQYNLTENLHFTFLVLVMYIGILHSSLSLI